MELIINADREGYGTDQIRHTMTVGELIECLSQYDEDTPVFLGHDRQSYGWYTYGGISWDDFNERDGEEGEDD